MAAKAATRDTSQKLWSVMRKFHETKGLLFLYCSSGDSCRGWPPSRPWRNIWGIRARKRYCKVEHLLFGAA